MLVLNNLRGVFEDKKLYGITPLETHEGFIFAGLLNSTLVRFFMDLSCRQLTGAQAIADIDVRIVKKIPILSICFLEDNKQAFKQAYDQIKSRPIDQRVANEYTMPDRRALDAIIFDALNLTQGERDSVYEAVDSSCGGTAAESEQFEGEVRGVPHDSIDSLIVVCYA